MRGALKKIDGITAIDTNIKERHCSFKVPKDIDIKGKLEEFAKTNEHIEGYSIN